MKKILILLFVAIYIYAKEIAVVDDSYSVIKSDDIEFVYANEFKDKSIDILNKEQNVIDSYKKSFGYEFDDKLYLGLLSSKNQIANAFSNQIPLNMQIDYIAGALYPDYFTSISWIDTLLYHESSHNFQLNPKKNLLSRYAHKILKNSLYNSILFPIFPVPNLFCSSFNLEGNAVLNESLHDNGGRLFNGYLKAMAITQAKSGYITPQRTYNKHLFFPYGTHNYIVGGYFQLYLAQKYGLDRVNHYFYNYSGQWLPIFTNHIFKESFGKDFEQLISEYNSWLLKEAKDFKRSKIKPLFSSKSLARFNSDKDEIYFLISNGKDIPKLVRVFKSDKKIKIKNATLKGEKLFKINGKFYGLNSGYIDPTNISVGLFDEDGDIFKDSQSKAIQYISHDGKDMIYFDIKNSLDRPLAFYNDKKIGKVNSSIIRSQNGDIYYFKQNGKKRELYKNGDLIYSYIGYFGYVCDVDKRDRVYFIANSKDGSTLYRFDGVSLKRVLDGDDIVDVRLLDDKEVLVETIDADGYNIGIAKLLDNAKDQNVYEYRYSVKKYPKALSVLKKDKLRSKKYDPITDLHYSSLDMSINYNPNSINSVDYDISLNFSDLLGYNRVSIFSSKYDNDTILGAGYDSSEHRLSYGFAGYKVLDHDKNVSNRGYGASIYLKYPFYKEGYRSVDSKLTYNISDEKEDRRDLIFTLSLADKRAFYHSFYLNYGNFLDLSFGVDRGDIIYGAKSYFRRDLGDELYIDFNVGGAYSESQNQKSKRGIKIDSYMSRFDTALSFTMPSLRDDIYAKSIIQSGLSVKKVLNFNRYFFTFPISLRRESIYGTYNNYQLKFKGIDFRSYNEFRVGSKLDLLFLNNNAIPLKVEYIYNPDLDSSNNFRVLFNLNL